MKVSLDNIARALLMTLWLTMLPVAAHADLWQDIRAADDAIEAWDYPTAKRLVQALENQHEDQAGVRYVSGRLDYHQGRYADAIRKLEAARQGIPSQSMHHLDTLLHRVQATHDLVKDYQRYTSPDGHFEILHQPRDAFLMPYAAETLEAAYYQVGLSLGFWPETPIRIEMFPRAKLLAEVSSLPEEAIKTTSTIGLCKYNKIMVTSPRGTVRGYRWRDTLAHEYVHLVISQKTRNRVPIWLHEGLAKYFETAWRDPLTAQLGPGREDILARRIEKNNLVPLDKMSPSIALLPSQEDASVAYAEVFTVIEYLVRIKGAQGPRHVLDAIANGASPEEAFAAFTEQAWPAFERRWMSWLMRERPKQKSPIDFEDEPILREDAQATEDGEFAGVSSPKARDHLKLGELLRARGFSAAALTEYQRAEAILGPVHPMVQSGAAAVYLELDEPEPVLRSLEQTTRWFPDFYVAYVYEATALNQLERYQEALAYTDQALSINPFDPRVFEQRAKAFEGLGRPDAQREAEQIFRTLSD